MIISEKLLNKGQAFEQLLEACRNKIETDSLSNRALLKASGTLFENVVCNYLNTLAPNYSLEGNFEQAGVYEFPDLYGKLLDTHWCGIEVKTSKNDWKCFGNSIFESKRISNIHDRIYVFFGNFSDGLQCRWARYDDCVESINITHSPRFQINMNSSFIAGTSVFSKMSISYASFYELSNSDKMTFVRQYKKKELGESVALWWLPETEEVSSETDKALAVKLFSNLDREEQKTLIVKALVLFPELYKSKANYKRLTLWMINEHGVVSSSLRDNFTSGGQYAIHFENRRYLLPRIWGHVETEFRTILKVLEGISPLYLEENWGVSSPPDLVNRLRQWKSLICAQASYLEFPMNRWLESLEENLSV